jgi:hypothetical protein
MNKIMTHGVDRINEMLEAIQAEVTEDPHTAEVEVFFKLLKASEESLYEHRSDPPYFHHPIDDH